jgi:uncharacterized protein (TIGR01777 family)
MRIVIAGGTGFLGARLAERLLADRHDVVVLTRNVGGLRPPGTAKVVRWQPNGTIGAWAASLEGADAIVNLAGESIAARRWSADHKRRILESRVQATRSLVEAIQAASNPPAVLVSGSAVGYYGPLGSEIVTEEASAGNDFLAGVCLQWEAEAARASARTRVVCIRTGLVLDRSGGALPQMLPPFKLGAGGPVGSGRHYWPWIHREDWVDLVRWAVQTGGAVGAVNATAPKPVTNAEFARALGRALHRPSFMPAPAFALRLMLGEMADALLLSGQRAVPAKAERLGFTFRYAELNDALAAIFGRP